MGGEMALEESGSASIGTSVLRGPLLGLLLEQSHPVGAYRLSSLLMQRLPAWQVTHSAVANLLKRLVAEGYARPSDDSAKGFVATRQARLAVEDWMQRPLCRQTVREELHARIASASPHHAPFLHKVVDDYERECFELLDAYGGVDGDSTPAGSWRSMTISLTRAAADETLRGNIKWSRLAKSWLRDWVAAHPSEVLPCVDDVAAVS
jgi:DNA-binding PadR family transcriptional regulator